MKHAEGYITCGVNKKGVNNVRVSLIQYSMGYKGNRND